MIRDSAGDGRLRRIRAQQRAMREVHSAQCEKADRPHAQMLFAAGAKRSLRDTNGCTDFGEIEWPVGICRQKFLEPRDDRFVAAAAGGRRYRGTFGEAPHHDMDKLIL